MRDYTIYVDADRAGRLSAEQQKCLFTILEKLPTWRVNLLWLIHGNKVGIRQTLTVIKSVHQCCKGRSLIVHIEVCSHNKKVTTLAKFLFNRLPFEFFEDKTCEPSDYSAMVHGNHPDGCMFNSCLGNTLYIMSDSTIRLCPQAKHIYLHMPDVDEDIGSMFETDSFKSLLIENIRKRSECKTSCSYFKVCQGGCPISTQPGNCSIQDHINEIKKQDVRIQDFEQHTIHLSELYRG